MDDDYYLLNIRNVNYEIDDDGYWHHGTADKTIDTKNEYVLLEKRTYNVKYYSCFVTKPQNSMYRGLEDIRVIQKDDELYYCASYQKETDSKIAISCHYYTPLLSSLPIRLVDSPFDRCVEKNWSMFVHHNQLLFVYGWSPFRVGRLGDDNKLEMVYEKRYTEPFFQNIKNSSIGVPDPVQDSIWFLVHFNSANERFRTYYHMFIVLDASTLNIVKTSTCFTFEKKKIEYCLGFVLEKDEVVFTYTTFDKRPRLLKVDRSRIEDMLINYKI